MSLKARLKRIEATRASQKKKQETPKDKAFNEWKNKVKRSKKRQRNFEPCSCGNLGACLKYAEATSEEEHDSLHEYRDMFLEILTEKYEEIPVYHLEGIQQFDSVNDNMKKVYRYLEEKEVNKGVDPPQLEDYREIISKWEGQDDEP